MLQSSLGARDHGSQVFLQTARAWAESQQRRALVRLLDGGSQRTFIQSDLSKSLQLKVLDEELKIFIFRTGGESAQCSQFTAPKEPPYTQHTAPVTGHKHWRDAVFGASGPVPWKALMVIAWVLTDTKQGPHLRMAAWVSSCL